ncbi:hypothetical protein N7513_013138 [Penicillium frequentans]|uniref:Uncharacterized protein n=1 Tax=Penicillium frequentans TaxID=3151616 RepID=A0AAD6GK42_9EURO|nr:hypothetical protein N7513_013138 [Penicillium glabrum]KAJ5552670.1 hypothetical protein N7494_002048 [Penicillium glabrum]
MRFSTAIFTCLAGAMLTSAMPVDKAVREAADSDDQVAYTWALPESRKREDSDDKVAYTWALPESRKREDSDDKVAYTWALPESRKH